MRGGDAPAALKRIPEVVICEILSGGFDVMVRLDARSLERIRKIWEDIAQMPGVWGTITALTLSKVIKPAAGKEGYLSTGVSTVRLRVLCSSARLGPPDLPCPSPLRESVRRCRIADVHRHDDDSPAAGPAKVHRSSCCGPGRC
ncbi:MULTISPECIES: Lrp/AsnC ligand binding domain-containing protein [Streptomyces]|uniref:Lrp/AsnC ligand binding domain-containing protein n=1 Tax=Streptomyces lycopersici TaxID=2974589 RepID=UPI0021D0766F|nr:Lrp/AsnC ligand binding domain-containing protein [Streptomyces sp. NEAU-383]